MQYWLAIRIQVVGELMILAVMENKCIFVHLDRLRTTELAVLVTALTSKPVEFVFDFI